MTTERWHRAPWRIFIVVPALVLAASCTGAEGPECVIDADCGDGVCARSGECSTSSDVRNVRVTWTIRGARASAETCAGSPELYIDFIGRNLDDLVSYDPVPCRNGQYFIDKLPSRFARVELGVDGQWYESAEITTAGTASLDLAPMIGVTAGDSRTRRARDRSRE